MKKKNILKYIFLDLNIIMRSIINYIFNMHVVYFYFYFRLFLETINEHPDYKNVPIEERNLNYRALRDVLPKTEKIKTKLLEQYSTEYELYQERKVILILKSYHYLNT